MANKNWLIKFISYFSLINFSFFILISNSFDWDYFLTTIELDLRSYLVFQEFPSWNYFLCGGAPRAADPQSYALSPLFLLPMIFGSFIGSKLILILSIFIGFYYLRKIYIHISNSKSDQSTFESWVIPTLFILSNYFISHFHHGHIPFSGILYSMPTFYYLLVCLERKLTTKEIVTSSLFLTSVLSSAFYQPLVFFILPLSLSSFLIVVIFYINDWRRLLQITLQCTLVFLGGIIPAGYKLAQVYFYQKEFPRTVTLSAINESSSLFDLLFYSFNPVYHFNFILRNVEKLSWGIWEHTNLSLLFFLFPIILLFRKKTSLFSRNHQLYLMLALGSLITFALLSMGNFSTFSPVTLLNKYILNQSLRVVGRFQVGLLFSLFLLFPLLTRTFSSNKNEYMKKVLFICILIANINIYLPYETTSLAYFADHLDSKMNVLKTANTFHITKKRNLSHSYMYTPTRMGHPILNCYNPIHRETLTLSEFSFPESLEKTHLPLIYTRGVSASCQATSYITPNQIHIGDDCPEELCININYLKPNSGDSWKKITTEGRTRYCRGSQETRH